MNQISSCRFGQKDDMPQKEKNQEHNFFSGARIPRSLGREM
jgi:hypothetical protein